MEGIVPVFQDVVGVPAHDDAGAFLRQLQDHAALDIPQKIGGGQAVHDAGHALRGEGVGEQAAAGGVLPVFLHELGGKAGFQGDLIHQLLVVEGDTQLFRHHMAHGASAGTEFPADGDDFLFHKVTS